MEWCCVSSSTVYSVAELVGIVDGVVPKIATSGRTFDCLGNIRFIAQLNCSFYIKACLSFGLARTIVFDPPDLFENKNMNVVVRNLGLEFF